MVEAFYAFVANTAVARSVSPYGLTVRAEKHGVKLLKHLHKRDLVGFFQ
jgi:hypothetical protein